MTAAKPQTARDWLERAKQGARSDAPPLHTIADALIAIAELIAAQHEPRPPRCDDHCPNPGRHEGPCDPPF